MKKLSNKDKLNYVYRVAIKCETLEQFRTMKSWIDRIPLDGSQHAWESDSVYYTRKDFHSVLECARQNVFKWNK